MFVIDENGVRVICSIFIFHLIVVLRHSDNALEILMRHELVKQLVNALIQFTFVLID